MALAKQLAVAGAIAIVALLAGLWPQQAEPAPPLEPKSESKSAAKPPSVREQGLALLQVRHSHLRCHTDSMCTG